MVALIIWRHYLYGVHVDVFTDHKVSNMFSLKRRLIQVLKDYDMSVLYHPGKSNIATDSLSRMCIGSVAHVRDGKKEFTKDVHRLAQLGFQLEYFPNGSFMVYHNYESS